MTAFFVWIILISLALSVYSIILWKRTKGGSRFQARLTILFFLFVLVPTVPLTLSVSVLLTKSTELFVLPDIEESLSESLQLMRNQLTEKCSTFLSEYTKPDSITPQILLNHQITYSGEISQEQNNFFITDFSFTGEIVKPTETIPENLDQFTAGQTFDALTRIDGKEYYEFYRTMQHGTFVFAGIELSDSFISTRERISWALRNYSSLSLLRDTFISQGLIWAIAVIFIILLTVIAIYTGKNISKGISEPIRQLTEGMKKIGSGDLTHRVKADANDEIEFLIESFNNMTDELQESRNNLKKAERAAAWRDIARQISHEIKNPLTPMQFSLHRIRQKMEKGNISDSDISESLEIIEEEIESMRRLASEFSEFARMPQMELKAENLEEVVKSSIKLFEGEVHKISVNLQIQDQLESISIDKEQFRRVIHNLLKNAMEASSAGEKVHVKLAKSETDDYKIKIEIKDFGSGMDQETIAKSLKPYFTTKANGSGLGLFIVNRIIQDHGGKLEIKSEINRGTTVTIQI